MPSPPSTSSPRSWASVDLRWASCSSVLAVIGCNQRDGTRARLRRWLAQEVPMAKATLRQRRTEGRVMHEFKHGELKSGRRGKGGKVKSRKQAIAIALSEAGASKYDSKRKQRHNRPRSARKEARGAAGQQEKDGKRHIGARGDRESTRAEGGKTARRRTAAGK